MRLLFPVPAATGRSWGRMMANVVVPLALLAAPGVAQLAVGGNHFIFQNTVGGVPVAGDRFGAALAVGEFDGDGYEDLAIGVPFKNVGSALDAGAIYIVFGSPAGLGRGSKEPLYYDLNIISGPFTPGTNDHFGAAMAAGKFNHTLVDALAVAAPNEQYAFPLLSSPGQGAVHVLYSFVPGGLSPINQYFNPHRVSVVTSAYSEFGAALATGESLGPDDREDLFIGYPGARRNLLSAPFPLDDVGLVVGLPGRLPGGLIYAEAIAYGPSGQEGDRAGAALAVGNLDGSGRSDLAYSAPFADPAPDIPDGGEVTIKLPAGDVVLSGAAAGDRFGAAVAVGDFSGSGYAQLLVGVPGRATDGAAESGLSFVFDLVSSGVAGVWQGFVSYPETPEPFDHFGEVLDTGDFNADGYDDAVFGVPGENLLDGTAEPVLDAGIVQVAYGSPLGLTPSGSQVWSLGSSVVLSPLDNDNYGGAVAAGDFNGDGVDDLAIGIPGAEWLGKPATGFVHILYGNAPIFGDGFEGGDTSSWSGASP